MSESKSFNKEDFDKLAELLEDPDLLMKEIEKIRNETELSQNDFAYLSDVSISTYKRWINEDQDKPKAFENLAKLARLASIILDNPSASKKEIKTETMKLIL